MKQLKSNSDYEEALKRIEKIKNAVPGSLEGKELELLATLIEQYEEENTNLPEPDPIDVIQYYIEQRGLKTKDLLGIIGDKTSISKILNRDRKLNIRMIRRIHNKFNIPYDLLMNEY